MTSCVTSAAAHATTPTASPISFKSSAGISPSPFISKIITDRQSIINKIIIDKQLKARALTLSENTRDLKNAVFLASQNINKTWYVFSGSTPRGWDCSGLVLWTYEHLGFDLYHGATAQMQSGRRVLEPKFGDIVGFKYNNASMFYHVGIYISEDLMLHSGGKRGDKTELRAISTFGGSYSKIEYTRLVDTN